ncbi:MAG TPA: NAD(P)/FAD-dependent oxidoreductase [Coxiellaceae bacterium]|nr:NAD(P)/FAD-dependent oxidoreductase [Coxiellaceae bacterium]
MDRYDVAIVGAGFTGLTAAFVLAKKGYKVHVIEADFTPGGLAGTFQFADGVKIEKFYHHWFNNDLYVPELVNELNMKGDVLTLLSKTGMYFNGRLWKLSTPLDLLRFTALSLIDRLRLGLLVLRIRKIKDWRSIEHLSIREWLEPLCGKNVFRVVWEPLINSKFSVYQESVNAVWMWKKLVLRGSTRNEKGGEVLAYFKGGFGRLAEALVDTIENLGGKISFGEQVLEATVTNNQVVSLKTSRSEITAKQFLFTPALPIIANILKNSTDTEWLGRLRQVHYLGNICLVLRLKYSLSDTYWLNVNDPGFPFVGVIEHTNFDAPENYKGSHIAYLSRYLATEDPLWNYTDEEYLDFALKHLQRMFPNLKKSWIIEAHVWREKYAQPVTERHYSQYVPPQETPFNNAFISTMAQIYPEDRGTNYAIREGRKVAEKIQAALQNTKISE